MTGPLPAISVIIPTRSAPAVLEQTLACLARQTLPVDCYEVIVVAGVAEDAVRMRVPAQLPYVLRIHQEPGPGAARRRNAGAGLARGALLVFLDDDMAADAGLLEAHQMAYAEAVEQAVVENQVVIGYLPPWFAGGPARPECMLTMNLRDWWEDTFRAMAHSGHRFVYSELFSGNFSLPAALFRRVGGFDPEFVCHEDYELGFRLLAAGAQFAVCLDARSLHNDTTDLRRLVRRKEAEGKADIQLARRHPVLGPSLPFARQVDGLPLPNRLLRGLARHWPWAGQAVTTMLLPLAALMERLKLRTSWQRLLGGLLVHSYWMGVFTETRHWPAIRALTSGPRTCLPQLQVDVANGFEVAESALEANRPNGVQITWHGLLLGQIRCQIGAEGLRPAHLRDWSEASGAAALHHARMLFASLGLEGERDDIRWPMAAYQPAEPEQTASQLAPALVSELELSGGLPALREQAGKGERRRVLVKRNGRPVGWLNLRAQPDARSEAELIQALFDALDPALLMDAPAVQAAEQNALPEISVVVCTRDRPERLDGCLRALREQTRPALEIIVVDNASSDERTAQIAGRWGARCVREPRPGLDFARNRGLEEATAPVVAYVDDDARPASDWLEALAKAFACGNGVNTTAGTGTDASVSAVTGMVGPVELETVAQNLFERKYGGMGHGFVRRLVRRNLLNPDGLLYASGFGVGTNMAFRRDVLQELGGFDPALDVGGPAGGGGDVEMMHRLVAAGYCLVYEPSALVWHQHRRDMKGLRRQIFDNGRSFGAYLLTCARRGSLPWHTIAVFALLNWGIGWHARRLLRPDGFPRSLVLAELAGALFSPWAYLRAVWRIKKLEKTR